MWGRKARRIAELEAKLADALENLVDVTIHTPPNLVQAIRGARKDTWYAVGYRFRVGDTEVLLGDTTMTEEPPMTRNYFDGEPVVAYEWAGGRDG